MGRTRKVSRVKCDEEDEERKRQAKAKKRPDEIEEEIQEVFRQFDADNSGSVDIKEIRHMLQILGQNPTKSEVRELVKEFDDNHNGQLDFDEFKTLIMGQLKEEQDREAELRDAFAVFDKDDSGTIEREELTKVLRSTGEKLSKEDIDMVFDAIDTNGDGKINYEEFAAAMDGGIFAGGD